MFSQCSYVYHQSKFQRVYYVWDDNHNSVAKFFVHLPVSCEVWIYKHYAKQLLYLPGLYQECNLSSNLVMQCMTN